MKITDRHKLVKDLIQSGLPENQSEIIGETFFGNNNLATKNDLKFAISDLKSELKADIANVKTDIAIIQQTIATTMATKSNLGEMKNEILKYMLSFFLGVVALNVATIGIVVSYLTK